MYQTDGVGQGVWQDLREFSVLIALYIHLIRVKPFSYEYGYLCFRIIAIALSVSLIERIQLLDMMTDEMMDDPETELLVTLTRYASAALASVLEATEDERDSNWLLGWIKSPHHPQQSFLVQRADTSSLLHTIWEDRKAFLKALVSTYLPGLSPVLFILWRYVSVEWYELFLGIVPCRHIDQFQHAQESSISQASCGSPMRNSMAIPVCRYDEPVACTDSYKQRPERYELIRSLGEQP